MCAHVGLNASRHDMTVNGAMSGSGERHTMYFYVHRGRLEAGASEAWWQGRVANARTLNAACVPLQIALNCAVNVLDGGSLAVGCISDMCTVSLFDTMILDRARDSRQ